MGAWVEMKLEVLQNETFSTQILYFNPPASGTDPSDEVPVDFSGATAYMSVRKAQNDEADQLLAIDSVDPPPDSRLTFVAGTFQGGPPVPGYNNGIQITITAEDTEGMPVGANWYWDMFVRWASGAKTYVARGQFQVAGTAARDA